MKKLLFILFALASVYAEQNPSINKDAAKYNKAASSQKYPIDKIIAVIYGPERKWILCQSDLERLSIDGRKLTLDELITEELIYQDALRYKIPIDEDAIDAYIRSIQRQHNMSLDDIKQIFRNSGYTYQEGRGQLRKMYAINAVMEHKIRSRIFVPERDVKAYYENHPEYKEAKFQIQVAIIPYDYTKSRNQQKKEIEQKLKTGKALTWGSPFWIQEDEIAEDKQFIIKMKPSDVSKPQEEEGGFEVYCLKAKKLRRLIPLKKRYREIVEILRGPKMNQMMEEYKKELLADASVVYFNHSTNAQDKSN